MTPLLGMVVSLMTGGGLAFWAEPPFPLLPCTFVLGPCLFVVAGRLAWAGHARVAMVVSVIGALLFGVTQARVAALTAWHPPGVNVADLERLSTAGAVVFVEGILRHDASPTVYGASLDLRADVVELAGIRSATDMGMRLSVGGTQTANALHAWTRGRRIRAPVSALRRPLPYRNFEVPDAEQQLALRRLRMFGSVKSAALVEWQRGAWWQEAASAVRARVRVAVRRLTPDVDAAAVVIAILIGDRTGLTPDQERRLQQAGTYHVIAISGGNVALWLGAIAWLPRWRRASVRMGTAIVAGSLLLFAVCVDGGASVGRASLVAALWLAARWWDLRTSALQATAGAAAVILVADPLAVHDPGFVLSFAATLALIVMGLRLQAAATTHEITTVGASWPRRLVSAGALVVLATAAVELLLLPIGARLFSLVTGVGLVANLLALPAMAVVQVAGIALVVFDVCRLTSLAYLAGLAAAFGVRVLVGSGMLVDILPALVRHVPPAPFGLVLGYYACLAVCVRSSWPCRVDVPMLSGRSHGESGRWRRWSPPIACVSGGAAAVLLAVITWGGPERTLVTPWTWGVDARVQVTPWQRDDWLIVTVLDVGQGDATVVQFPNGRVWAVDAGGAPSDSAFDVGARVTAPAVWALGHRRLDRVILTHGHADHGGGLPALLERFSPRELLLGIPVLDDPVDPMVLQAAAGRRALVRQVRAGERFAEGQVAVRVLHPPEPDWQRVRVRNDDSVALWLRYGDVGVLLPGDAGLEVEEAWTRQVSAAPVVALRAGHHGSRSSSGGRLLEHFRPAVVIASAGRGNRFGHPHEEVLRRARQAGAAIWRTDIHGAVQLATNGRVMVLRTAAGCTALVTGQREVTRLGTSCAPPA